MYETGLEDLGTITGYSILFPMGHNNFDQPNPNAELLAIMVLELLLCIVEITWNALRLKLRTGKTFSRFSVVFPFVWVEKAVKEERMLHAKSTREINSVYLVHFQYMNNTYEYIDEA